MPWRRVSSAFALVSCLLVVSSCAGIRGGKGAGSEVAAVPAAPSEEESRRELVGLIERDLRNDLRSSSNGRNDLLRKDPYYYKEYSEYPAGLESYELTVTPKDSKTAPYVADVSIERVRYATRLNRNREAAQADNDFIRNTGELQMSYELRNGSWRRVSSLFVAERTEEMVDGEWRAVRDVAPPAFADRGESRSWFGRTMDRLRFWN